MSDIKHMSRNELLMRALEEDHAAIEAWTDEARVEHRSLADLMRQTADEMLDSGSEHIA